MTNDQYAADLALALSLADEADRITLSRYRALDLIVETKADSTPVTEADRAVEDMVRTRLATERPGDEVLGEEYGTIEGSGTRRWIVDPIDGTANYVRKVPVWCTLIALLDGDDVVVGIASAPALSRRWWASTGAGAWTLDTTPAGSPDPRRISVSAVSDLANASVSYSDPVGWDAVAPGGLERLIGAAWRSRAYGDFWSHVLVAEGAVDIAAEPALSAWDMAALIPIITEAGGQVTGLNGAPAMSAGNALCSNGILHSAALTAVAGMAQQD